MKHIVRHAALGSVAALAVGAMMLPAPVAAQDNNTLRVGMYSKTPARGNPYGGGGVPSIYWWDPLFDGMTRVNKEGVVTPWLAESWKLVDNTTWHFKLKPNLEFSNGAKIDADAVVGSFAWALSDEGRATSGGRELREIERVTKVDNLTVEIKTKAPAPLTPGTLQRAYILEPKHLKDVGIPGYTANPVTSGGYKVVRWTDNDAEYTVFDKSWRPGKIRTLRFVELPEAASRLQAITSKQIDLAVTVAPDDIKQVRDAGQVVHVFGAPNIMNFVMFTKDFKGRWGAKGTPFADKRVRMAANMSIDRQSIVDNLLGGVTSPANQPANPSTFGYNPSLPQYKYDPVAAKKLLADAGYPNGFEFTLDCPNNRYINDEDICKAVVSMWARLGLKVNLNAMPRATYFAKIQKFDTSAYLLGWGVPTFDALYSLQSLAMTVGKEGDGNFNLGRVSNPEFDKLVTAMKSEVDVKKRNDVIARALMLHNQQVMHIPLHNQVIPWAMRKNVTVVHRADNRLSAEWVRID